MNIKNIEKTLNAIKMVAVLRNSEVVVGKIFYTDDIRLAYDEDYNRYTSIENILELSKISRVVAINAGDDLIPINDSFNEVKKYQTLSLKNSEKYLVTYEFIDFENLPYDKLEQIYNMYMEYKKYLKHQVKDKQKIK